jgi:molybdopterin synthase catalytic subunit
MQHELHLSTAPIEQNALLLARAARADLGAIVTFVGVVRDTEGGRPIAGLEYEAFQKMVEHQFELLFAQIEQRWPVASIRLVHRLGVVPAGEPSLWVEVLAPHRGEAFAACQYLIDEMKRVVPIWKKPILPQGANGFEQSR